jgi:glucokinase
MIILAVDLGGTKTLFQLSNEIGEVLAEVELASQSYDSFDDALAAFFSLDAAKAYSVDSACFAIAGPVDGRKAQVTNLPWQIDADDILTKFPINRLVLCNDFAAVGYGISALSKEDVITLQTGTPSQDTSVRAVIGAGTGLGQALLVKQDEQWQVLATEGGHVDFAPQDANQDLLLQHMRERFGNVSYERVLSGPGLVEIYEFLRGYLQKDEDPALRQAMIMNDPAAAISQFANQQSDSLAADALAMFFKVYGAQTGNLALACLPYGGIYIAGGIAVKNLDWFENSEFLSAFNAKGKMTDLMQRFPIHVIKHPQVGLLGAKTLAKQSIV